VHLIPAIDLRGGHCVRLYQGLFGVETRYEATPEETLGRYRSLGAPWVHVVDLDGARDGNRVNEDLIERMAVSGSPKLQVGGGIRSAATIERLLDAGVSRIVLGSAAVDHQEDVLRWFSRFGPERICLAFDVRQEPNGDPRVNTNGWTRTSTVTLWEALTSYSGAVRHVLCTDIDRDGTLAGPNLDLYRSCMQRFPNITWQASGGIRDAEDLRSLKMVGVAAAVSGKAMLENRIPLSELTPFLPDASFPASTSVTARS
jgi:phosphoribosylformimino-5-aminoimidazole carboxamide ribotide isomerase